MMSLSRLYSKNTRGFFKLEFRQESSTVSHFLHTSKMSSVEAGPRPVQVSPTIKFFRWSLLLAGIAYGAYFQRKFSKIENARREKELQEKPMRDAKLAAEKKKLQEAEVKMLDELLQIKK